VAKKRSKKKATQIEVVRDPVDQLVEQIMALRKEEDALIARLMKMRAKEDPEAEERASYPTGTTAFRSVA
jgi:hypothetical protein